MVTVEQKLRDYLPASLTVPGISEQEFLSLCEQFPDAKVEYHADGTLTIMPPADPDSSRKQGWINYQLVDWVRRTGRGYFTEGSGGFRFPDGSRLSPDATWFDDKRWRAAKKTGERYPVFTPEFVIELRSPDDRLSALRAKMESFIENGVLLGWLIDPIRREVTIFRPGRDPEVLKNPKSVTGEGPVDGFVLDLSPIFD